MSEWLLAAVAELSPWEAAAVVLAIAYLLLAMRENILCWYCALASATIYTVLFWDASLPMQSLLNIYYMGMAVYGWWQWRRGGESHAGVVIQSLPVKRHLALLAGIVAVSAVSGYWLDSQGAGAWPFADAFTTWASLVVSWMVAKKILENWLYWIVIDGICVFMYFDRGLHLSSLLFAAYVVIAVFGYISWRAHSRRTLSHEPAVSAC